MKFTSFVQLLLSGATNYPDNVALLYDEGGTTVKKTYAQLYADVKDRVRALESMKETCVGIIEAPSEKWIVDMFACVIAGKQTVLLDAMSDAATLQKCVLATDVETILTDNLTAPYATALKFCPHTLNRTDGEGDILFFTSGTTESSKAVEPVQRKRQSALRASAHSRVRVRMFDVVAVVAGRVRVVDKGASLSPVRREIFQPDDYIRRAVRVEIPFELQRA